MKSMSAKMKLIKIWPCMYKRSTSSISFNVFVSQAFVSPEKILVTAGMNFSWSFSIKNRKNGDKIVMITPWNVPVMTDEDSWTAILPTSNEIDLSESVTLLISVFTQSGKFPVSSMSLSTSACASVMIPVMFFTRFVTCSVMIGPMNAMATQMDNPSKTKIDKMLAQRGNLYFSKNVWIGTVM